MTQTVELGADEARSDPPQDSSWPAVQKWRIAERRRLRERIAGLGVDGRRWRSELIGEMLWAFLLRQPGDVVSFYWPMAAEVDLRPLMRRAKSIRITVALPVVVEANRPVEFWRWQEGMTMRPGIWNIPVPRERENVHPALVLAPLVGFDDRSFRLGNGGGYFDRTLAKMASDTFVIGVGYEASRIPSIFPQPHDIRMDAILTERRFDIHDGDASRHRPDRRHRRYR